MQVTTLQTQTKLSDLIGELKEKTLVIGAGEIGKSLKNVLSVAYDVEIRDKEEDDNVNSNYYRVINICYPYSSQFVEVTKEYIGKYKPELTIIHSTVKPGTTKQLGSHVIHSPINGRHPHLEEGIKSFVKFVGGEDVFDVFKGMDYLNKAGLSMQAMANSTATELAKVLCTTYYGWNLVYMKEVARLCKEHNVPFQEVYAEWNNAYNQGYSKLNEYRFMRPVLFPIDGPIGGHCVIPNCELLEDWLTDTVKGRNQTYKEKPSDPSRSKDRRRDKNL